MVACNEREYMVKQLDLIWSHKPMYLVDWLRDHIDDIETYAKNANDNVKGKTWQRAV